MKLRLALPQARFAPLRWAAEVLFVEIMGLDVEFLSHPDQTIVLSAENSSLSMPSLFPDLSVAQDEWHLQIPGEELPSFDAAVAFPEVGVELPVPVLFGKPSVLMTEGTIALGMDVLGTAFFSLSRFEEVALPERDRFDRFPATASLACKVGFLERPIVDEYAEILRAACRRLWPGLWMNVPEGRVIVSCDVDQPFDRVGTSARALLRSLAGDLGRRRKPSLALRRTKNFFAHRAGDLRFDPYYTFDWYLDTCERHGRSATFHFISDHSAGAIDGNYDIYEPRILELIKMLHERGHEIGMHGSFNTFRHPEQVVREKARLAKAIDMAGTGGKVACNRQHYLRWDSAETQDHLNSAGFDYDTTGSFADRPGFRYGTAFEFSMWSWRERNSLHLRQIPLIVMEASVMAKGYLGLGRTEAALAKILELKRRAVRFGGNFSLLWHNSEFLFDQDREIFEAVIT